MLSVGITGGIGSGKTTACRIFETLGIHIYYADDRAKQLMVEIPELVVTVKQIFGDHAYHEDGSLNRGHISSIAFHDKAKLAELNTHVHAAVFSDTMQWEMSQRERGVAYTLKEAALLVESGSYQFLDKMIVVTAPLETRIERVISRDGHSRAEIEARIRNQMPEEEKVKLAHYIINNDGRHLLIPQILEIHKNLIALAAAQTNLPD